jgi:hypothetical protein
MVTLLKSNQFRFRETFYSINNIYKNGAVSEGDAIMHAQVLWEMLTTANLNRMNYFFLSSIEQNLSSSA